jgi:hypothetical protein
MINPESLDLSALPWLPLEAKSAFPKQSAIYFAIDSLGNIQYIGRSVNVKNRWVQLRATGSSLAYTNHQSDRLCCTNQTGDRHSPNKKQWKNLTSQKWFQGQNLSPRSSTHSQIRNNSPSRQAVTKAG